MLILTIFVLVFNGFDGDVQWLLIVVFTVLAVVFNGFDGDVQRFCWVFNQRGTFWGMLMLVL